MASETSDPVPNLPGPSSSSKGRRDRVSGSGSRSKNGSRKKQHPYPGMSKSAMARNSNANMSRANRMDILASPSPVFVLLDIDAFEVAAWWREKKFEKKRNTPCVVAHDTSHRIFAVSYEAKALGITRNMKLEEAKAILPGIYVFWKRDKFGKQDNTKARQATFDVIQSITRFCSELGDDVRVELASSDEIYVDLSAEVTRGMENKFLKYTKNPSKRAQPLLISDKVIWEQQKITRNGPHRYFSPETRPHEEKNFYFYRNKNDERLMFGAALVEKIIQRLQHDTGMSASAGVANNKMMAKLACGLHKPAKITVCGTEAVRRISSKIPIERIPGLGGGMGERLKKVFNITQMSEIRRIQQDALIEEFGTERAKEICGWARGECTKPVIHKIRKEMITCNKPSMNIKQIRCLNDVVKNLNGEIRMILQEERQREKRTTNQVKVEVGYISKRHPLDLVTGQRQEERRGSGSDSITTGSRFSLLSLDSSDNDNDSTRAPTPTPAPRTRNGTPPLDEYTEKISESFDISDRKHLDNLATEVLRFIKSLKGFDRENFKIVELAFVLKDFQPLQTQTNAARSRSMNRCDSGFMDDQSTSGSENEDRVDSPTFVPTVPTVVPTTLRVQTKMSDSFKVPKFEIVRQLGSFRLRVTADPNADISLGVELPELIAEEKWKSLIGKNLGVGYKTTAKLITDHVTYDANRHHAIVKWLREVYKPIMPTEVKPDFIALNGRIAETLKTPANKKFGGWAIFGMNCNDIIYLWEEKILNPHKLQNPQGYYGNYFERLMTSKDGEVETVNEGEDLYLVNDVKFGKHKMLLVSNMDAKKENKELTQISVFKEDYSNDPAFLVERELKLWAQTVTSGADVVVKGTRSPEGILKEVQLFSTEEFTDSIDANLDACYEFETRFLDWVKMHLPKSDKTLVKEFKWCPSQEKSVYCTEHPKNGIKQLVVPQKYFKLN